VRVYNLNEIKNSLKELREEQFTFEREIQRIVEMNLELLFGLEFVKSEFDLHGLRIDTLAFNREDMSFVIIEYKRDRNFSVIDQGIAYLNLMLNNKADFILEYNETARNKSNINRNDLDWSQSRVIFIAPEFTRYQQHAIGFRDLGIQLFEVHKYANGVIVLDENKPFYKTESFSTIARKDSQLKRVSEEIKVYNEEDLLGLADDNTKELYRQLKSSILNLGPDVEVRPTKKYIAFRRNKGFVGLVILSSKIKAYLSLEIDELNDPARRARDVHKIGHYSPGDVEVTISDQTDIPYLVDLVRQAYQCN
jgi:predicted transport protein